MALTENRIDIHQFISLQGQIIPPSSQKMIDERPGVDSHEFVVTGRKGRLFSLMSQVDEESYDAAKYLLTVYQRLIDEGAVEIVQSGVSGDSNDYRVVVIAVEAVQILPIRGAQGNYYSSNPQALLIARWDLVAVPFIA